MADESALRQVEQDALAEWAHGRRPDEAINEMPALLDKLHKSSDGVLVIGSPRNVSAVYDLIRNHVQLTRTIRWTDTGDRTSPPSPAEAENIRDLSTRIVGAIAAFQFIAHDDLAE